MTILAATKQFLEEEYKNPFWYIATAVFLTLLGFMLNYQLNISEERARLETSNNERVARLAESGRLCTLRGEVLSVMNATAQPLSQYMAIYKSMIDTKMLPAREQVEENYKSTLEAIKREGFLAARLKGIHFSVRVHDEEARKLEAIIASELNVLKVIEDFCATFLADNVEKFAQHIRETSGRLSAILKENETINATEQGINLQMEQTIRANLTEDKRAAEQAVILTAKKYAQIPAITFCIGYCILIIRSVKNVRKKSIKVSARPTLGKPRPKKRKVKR